VSDAHYAENDFAKKVVGPLANGPYSTLLINDWQHPYTSVDIRQ
jgi:hypothetical protein